MIMNKKKIIYGVKKSIRVFPYSEYLLTFLPFYAYLYQRGIIESVWTLLLMIPFILANAGGFIYNTICDASSDSPKKNPIAAGLITKKDLYNVLYAVLCTTIILFIILYNSGLAILCFIAYILLWLSYSGLQIRFKESLLGPMVASIVLWVGGPFILLINYKYIDAAMFYLLASFFLIYTSNELNHQIGGYIEDRDAGTKTFTVRVGMTVSILLRIILLALGCMFFVLSAMYVLNLTILASIASYLILLLVLFAFDIASYPYFLVDSIKSLFNKKQPLYPSILLTKKDMGIFHYSPFSIFKVFIVLYTCMIMNFSIWVTVMLLWVFVTSKRT